MRLDLKTSARFWSKVNVKGVDDCWEWKAGIHSLETPYGQFGIKRRLFFTHRISWTIHNGSIPNGLCVLHKCDNHRCVNPSHLFLGTHIDNARDRVQKGRNGNSGRKRKT